MAFKTVVFVADYFAHQYAGGSEKSLEAIIASAPPRIQVKEINSKDFRHSLFDKDKDFLVFANFNQIPAEELRLTVAKLFKYAVIESDFKFCRYRLPEMHRSPNSHSCGCEKDPQLVHVRNLYLSSMLNFFKSDRHLARHLDALPFLKRTRNMVLSVTYKPEELVNLLDLRFARKGFRKRFFWDKPSYAVYDSNNWIKGRDEALLYAKSKDLRVRLINAADSALFQRQLSECHGFIFMPRGLESCSRMAVEAKILGLEMHLNENVGAGGDAWFNSETSQMIAFLKGRTAVFWQEIERLMK